MEEDMEKEKNIVMEQNYYLMGNIKMEKGMEKGESIMAKIIYYLKESI